MAVRQTLDYWTSFPPKAGESLAWPDVVKNCVYRMPTLPPPPSFTLPQWEPDLESIQRYERKVRAAAEKLARQHVAKALGVLETSSYWPRVRSTRGGGPKRPASPRWRWLAEFQVCGKSYFDIADGEVESSTVRRSVAAAAARIELKLRR